MYASTPPSHRHEVITVVFPRDGDLTSTSPLSLCQEVEPLLYVTCHWGGLQVPLDNAPLLVLHVLHHQDQTVPSLSHGPSPTVTSPTVTSPSFMAPSFMAPCPSFPTTARRQTLSRSPSSPYTEAGRTSAPIAATSLMAPSHTPPSPTAPSLALPTTARR